MRHAVILILLTMLAACASGGGDLSQAMNACQAGSVQACDRLPALANGDEADGGMGHSDRVTMDVAAIVAGMQRARAHELVAGRIGP